MRNKFKAVDHSILSSVKNGLKIILFWCICLESSFSIHSLSCMNYQKPLIIFPLQVNTTLTVECSAMRGVPTEVTTSLTRPSPPAAPGTSTPSPSPSAPPTLSPPHPPSPPPPPSSLWPTSVRTREMVSHRVASAMALKHVC